MLDQVLYDGTHLIRARLHLTLNEDALKTRRDNYFNENMHTKYT